MEINDYEPDMFFPLVSFCNDRDRKCLNEKLFEKLFQDRTAPVSFIADGWNAGDHMEVKRMS